MIRSSDINNIINRLRNLSDRTGVEIDDSQSNSIDLISEDGSNKIKNAINAIRSKLNNRVNDADRMSKPGASVTVDHCQSNCCQSNCCQADRCQTNCCQMDCCQVNCCQSNCCQRQCDCACNCNDNDR